MSDGGDAGDGEIELGEIGEDESEDQEQYKELVERDFTIPHDIYGDAIVSFVAVSDFMTDRPAHKGEYARFYFAMSALLLCFNFLLQLGFASILYLHAIEQSSRHYEPTSKLNLLEAEVENATMLLPADSDAVKLCEFNQVHFLDAYWFILFMWFSRMVIETALSMWLIAVLVKTPRFEFQRDDSLSEMLLSSPRVLELSAGSNKHVVSGRSMLQSEGTERFKIVGLTPLVQSLTLALVAIPKLITALWITFVGLKFLVFTHDTSSLILKGLALQWFVTIDELLLKAFVSENKQHHIRKTVLKFRGLNNEAWDSFGSSVVRIFAVAMCLILGYAVLYGDVLHFRTACEFYKRRFPKQYPDFAEPTSIARILG